MVSVRELNRDRGVFRVAEFGIAAVVGFIVAEAIIVAGLYSIYGKTDIPSMTASSPALLVLDVFALIIGVTVSFEMNERTTVRSAIDGRRGVGETLVRLMKFQGVSALGNVVVIVVQLVLLSTLALSPAFGNIIGGVVAYPVSYFVSMRHVWGHPF